MSLQAIALVIQMCVNHSGGANAYEKQELCQMQVAACMAHNSTNAKLKMEEERLAFCFEMGRK